MANPAYSQHQHYLHNHQPHPHEMTFNSVVHNQHQHHNHQQHFHNHNHQYNHSQLAHHQSWPEPVEEQSGGGGQHYQQLVNYHAHTTNHQDQLLVAAQQQQHPNQASTNQYQNSELQSYYNLVPRTYQSFNQNNDSSIGCGAASNQYQSDYNTGGNNKNSKSISIEDSQPGGNRLQEQTGLLQKSNQDRNFTHDSSKRQLIELGKQSRATLIESTARTIAADDDNLNEIVSEKIQKARVKLSAEQRKRKKLNSIVKRASNSKRSNRSLNDNEDEDLGDSTIAADQKLNSNYKCDQNDDWVLRNQRDVISNLNIIKPEVVNKLDNLVQNLYSSPLKVETETPGPPTTNNNSNNNSSLTIDGDSNGENFSILAHRAIEQSYLSPISDNSYGKNSHRNSSPTTDYQLDDDDYKLSVKQGNSSEYNQLRILEMRKEKSRDAARSRRSKENHEFYELAKLLPLPAAITSQLVNGHPPWAPDFTTLGSINPYSSQSLMNYAEQQQSSNYDLSLHLDTPASATSNKPISDQNHNELRAQHQRPHSLAQKYSPLTSKAPLQVDLNQLGANQSNSLAPYGAQGAKGAASLFDIHQGTHILQSLDGFAFAIGRDGRFLYISETVSMYLGLSQVEMTGSSVFDYTHQHDHAELAKQLGIPCTSGSAEHQEACNSDSPPPAPTSVHSQYSTASNETMIEDYMTANSGAGGRKRGQAAISNCRSGFKRNGSKQACSDEFPVKRERFEQRNFGTGAGSKMNDDNNNFSQEYLNSLSNEQGTDEDPLVRQFCIRMKSTLTKRGCQHFKSSGYRVVHIVAHLRSYQSNDHGHLMDPLDSDSSLKVNQDSQGDQQQQQQPQSNSSRGPTSNSKQPAKRRGPKPGGLAKSSSDAGKLREAPEVAGQGLEMKSLEDEKEARGGKRKIIGLVAVAIALPPPSINELRLESDTFVLRLNLDLKITHIEPKLTEILNYPIELIANKSLYSLIHPADSKQLQKCHRDLLRKGQMMSGYYRLLARNGGFIWIQTCATLICNNNTNSLATNNQSLGSIQSPLQSYDSPTPSFINKSLLSQSPSNEQLAPGKQQYGPAPLQSPPMVGSGGEQSVDQDQCIIFVNYMITNVIECDEIVDLCQSSNYAPTIIASSNTSTSNNHLLQQFNNNPEPTSSATPTSSSACLSPSLKAAGGQHYLTTSSAGLAANLSGSPAGHGQQQHLVAPRRNLQERKFAGRKSKLKQIAVGNSSANSCSHTHELNSGQQHLSANNYSNNTNGNYDNQHSRLTENLHQNLYQQDYYANYGHSQQAGGVNLALNHKSTALESLNTNQACWLNHHYQQEQQGQQVNYANASAASVTASAPAETNQPNDAYSSSIYKAAFANLDVVSGYNHHQQVAAAAAAVVYPAASAGYHQAHTPSAHSMAAQSPWDQAAPFSTQATSTSSAHQQQHPATAAAAAAAGNYYNYYGYYGNKFI